MVHARWTYTQIPWRKTKNILPYLALSKLALYLQIDLFIEVICEKCFISATQGQVDRKARSRMSRTYIIYIIQNRVLESSGSDWSAKHAGNTHWQPVLQWQTLWSAANSVAHCRSHQKHPKAWIWQSTIIYSYCQSNSKMMCFKTCHVAAFYNGTCKSIYLTKPHRTP